jgi:RNA polymerase sigma factor (sigma-70 family)
LALYSANAVVKNNRARKPGGGQYRISVTSRWRAFAMAAETQKLLGHLLRLTDQATSDAALVTRWAQHKDEDAFATLVARHGPMVLGVCQRVLGDRQHAEDAFQAAFLVLARKAGSVQPPEALPAYLYGVAIRIARKARRARRCQTVPAYSEAAEPTDPRPHTLDALSGRELLAMVDAEVLRLPEVYRLPVLLCVLQERSVDEAARILDWSTGSVRGRLARGRQMLRQRLMDRGLAPFGGALALLAPARLPHHLVSATLRNLTSAVPATVNALAAGAGVGLGIKVLCVACVLTAVGLGAGLPLSHAPEAPPPLATVPAAPIKKPRLVDLLGDPLPPGAIMRLGTVRHRSLNYHGMHEQPLPDGKTVLAGHHDIRWVDMSTGLVSKTWPLPDGSTVCGFSCDGLLALLNDGDTLGVWNLISRQEVRKLEKKGRLSSDVDATFSPDGKTIAATIRISSVPGLLRVWDVESGRQLWQVGQLAGGRPWWVLAFLPDNQTLVVMDDNNRVMLRDRDTGRIRRSFLTPGGPYLSPDGKTALCGTGGPAVRVWDVATGKELPPLGGHERQAHHFAFSRDGKTLLTGGQDSYVLVRDWPAGKPRRRIDLEPGRSIGHLGVSMDGRRAECVLHGDHVLRFFDLETGKELPRYLEAHESAVNGVAVLPGGEVVSAGTDNTIRFWDLASGRNVRTIRTKHPLGAMTMAVSADGRLIASGEINNGLIALHDLKEGIALRTIDSGGASITTVAFSPEGRLLAASGDGARPGSGGWRPFLLLCDANTGREIRRWEGANTTVPVFNPDGRLLATCGIDEFCVREIASGRVLRTLLQKNAGTIAFSPDGRTLACRDEDGISLWELASGQERCRIDAKGGYRRFALRYSPTGRLLTGAGSNSVSVWDARSGKPLRTFTGHGVPGYYTVEALAFTADSRVLISASFDTTLLVWDVPGLAEQQHPPPHLPEKAVTAAWNDLRSADARAAYRAVQTLVDAPAQSLSLLRRQLQKAPAVNGKQIERWLAGLSSSRFAERDQAVRELERLGDNALAPLRRFLASQPSLEAKRRAERLLDRLEGPVTDPQRLQQTRALEVAELIGNAEARQLLDELAHGYPDANLTQQATAAMSRLRRQTGTTANP